MNREERERMVDRLLNEAVSPQEVEPRAGLEQRILANLRAQPEGRPWRKWMWAATTAVLLIVIGLMVTRRPEPVKAPVAIQQKPVAPAPTTSAALPAAIVATGRKPSRRSPVAPAITSAKTASITPRQPAFAPGRLTDAERALVAMLRSNPDEAKAVAERQEQARQEGTEFMEQALMPKQ
jgi:hypothetical protein